jgi:hypothetical protein
VIRELTDFLAVNHHEFFDECFHIPREHYLGEAAVRPFIIPRISSLKSKDGKPPAATKMQEDADDLIDIVLPKDRADLTDFVDFVMEQVAVCRATQDDVARRSRRIPVGHPGLVCRHCLGASGDGGKYFFSSLDSLNTAATTLEKHIAKCSKIGSEIKTRLIECRSRHQEQRTSMPPGMQGAFFARLWDRLRSSKASFSSNSDGYVSLTTNITHATVGSSSSDAGATTPDGPPEFKNHVWLMHYLRKTSPWCDNRELQEAVDQYYNCLDYGGRIFNTSAMPLHFNSEWLLSKVAPRGKVASKR